MIKCLHVLDELISRCLYRATWYLRAAIMVTLLLGFGGHVVFSQNKLIGLDLLDRDGREKVDFKMEQGFIVVKVWLQGIIPLKMIFDTGAENTILFDKEIDQLLGIEFERQIPIMGSDLDSVLIANIARRVKMRLEGCESVNRDIIVLENNNLLLREKLGIEVNGIIGGSFFSNLVVKIDYSKKEILLQHPNKFKPPKKNYQKFDMDIRSSKPYLVADLTIREGTTIPVRLLMDTGAALAFLIHTNTDSALTLPGKIMLGHLGYGLSGVLKGYLGKSRKLQLGSFEFHDIATSFQDLDIDTSRTRRTLIRNGILGNTFLSRFKVIIDYNREALYLRGGRKYNKEFEFDKSGLTIFAIGSQLNQYYVVAVLIDSPAYRADIRPGDLIYKLGQRKTQHMTLQDITRKLSRRTGKKIKVTLIRDEIRLKREFRLEEWYKSKDYH